METETIQCQRCRKMFERKKSVWNTFDHGLILCQKCSDSYDKWWSSQKDIIVVINKRVKELKKIQRQINKSNGLTKDTKDRLSYEVLYSIKELENLNDVIK